jgi:hypothetical protein
MSKGQMATYTELGRLEGQLAAAAATQLWAMGGCGCGWSVVVRRPWRWRQLLASYQRAAGAASCVCGWMGGGRRGGSSGFLPSPKIQPNRSGCSCILGDGKKPWTALHPPSPTGHCAREGGRAGGWARRRRRHSERRRPRGTGPENVARPLFSPSSPLQRDGAFVV